MLETAAQRSAASCEAHFDSLQRAEGIRHPLEILRGASSAPALLSLISNGSGGDGGGGSNGALLPEQQPADDGLLDLDLLLHARCEATILVSNRTVYVFAAADAASAGVPPSAHADGRRPHSLRRRASAAKAGHWIPLWLSLIHI